MVLPPDRNPLNKPMMVEFTTQIFLDDFRPLLVIKSHSELLSTTSAEICTAICPEPLDAHELSILISQRTIAHKALTPEEKFQAHVKDMGRDLKARVYNAIRWNLEQYPEYFANDFRVVYIPHGNPVIAIGMVQMLAGLFGVPPLIGVVLPVGGELVLNPENPFIDLGEWQQAGRKLREYQPHALERKHRFKHTPPATQAREQGNQSQSDRSAKMLLGNSGKLE